MNLLKNRTVIGLVCIVLSVFVCFGLTPLFNSARTAQTEIVRVSKDIRKGDLITPDMLETVTVGAHNLPNNIIKTKDAVVDKYALTDFYKGDYVLPAKLSEYLLTEFEYLNTLDGSKQAISVTIKSFASGLSGKLEQGDIVTLIASDYGDNRETLMLPELQYVYVLAVTTGSGSDKNAHTNEFSSDDKERELPATITLLVNYTQVELLADLESKGRLHAALVYRGDRAISQQFLAEQDKYIEEKLAAQQAQEDDSIDNEGAEVQ